MIPLPDGYTLENSKRRATHARASLVGSDWQVDVYYKGEPAFKLAKQYRVDIKS